MISITSVEIGPRVEAGYWRPETQHATVRFDRNGKPHITFLSKSFGGKDLEGTEHVATDWCATHTRAWRKVGRGSRGWVRLARTAVRLAIESEAVAAVKAREVQS